MTQANVTDTLGIVVVNYGSHRLLERNLQQLDVAALDVLIVVVDNFSTVAERSSVLRLAETKGWQFLGLPDNDGFGAGANAGLQHALRMGCTSFLILNPDAQVSPEVVTELHDHLRRDHLALVSPRLVDSTGRVAFQGSQVYLDTGRIKGLQPPADAGEEIVSARMLSRNRQARAWLPGTCLAVHADLLERVGSFHEPYFLYWEDVDLSIRCTDVGGTLVIRHDLQAVHDEGGTQDRSDDRALSSRYYYWNCRNRLVFAARHLSARQLLRWIVHTPGESWQILLRGGRRQLVQSPTLLFAAVRGSTAGIVIAVAALVRTRRARPAPASS